MNIMNDAFGNMVVVRNTNVIFRHGSDVSAAVDTSHSIPLFNGATEEEAVVFLMNLRNELESTPDDFTGHTFDFLEDIDGDFMPLHNAIIISAAGTDVLMAMDREIASPLYRGDTEEDALEYRDWLKVQLQAAGHRFIGGSGQLGRSGLPTEMAEEYRKDKEEQGE